MALEDIVNKIVEFYHDLHDKYEDFIVQLEERGVPNPHVLVPLAALVILVAAAVLLAPILAPSTIKATYTIKDQSTLAAIEAATVVLFNNANNQTIGTQLTDASGSAVFLNVPERAEQRVEITAPNYVTLVQTLPAGTTQKQFLLQTNLASLKKVLVNVNDENNRPVPNALVELASDTGTVSGVSGADGRAEIPTRTIPLIATIRVSSASFASEEQSFLGADLSTGAVTIILKSKDAGKDPTLAEKGTLSVVVSDFASGQPVRALVSILAEGSLSEIASAYSGASDGIAAFDKISFGTKFIINVKDPSAKYADYSSQDAIEFSKDATTARVLLRPRSAGGPQETVISVKDKDGAGIVDATVNVFDRSSGKLLSGNLKTDASGITRFNAAQALPLYITAQKIPAGPEEKLLLPGFVFAVAGEPRTITLQDAVEGGTASVRVEVTGPDGLPASDAAVSLFARGGRLDGFFLAGASTGADGVIIFPMPITLEGDSYNVFAKATRKELAGESDAVSAALETPTLSVLIKPVEVEFSVKTIDFVSKTAVAAQVSVFAGNTLIGSCSTSSTPACKIKAPAGVAFNIVANAPGFLTYTSAQETLAATDHKEFNAPLYPLSAATQTSITFEGLFNDKGLVREVSNADRYKAKFLVTTPSADVSGFYIRIGSAANVKDDVAGISDFDRVVTPTVYTSLSYTPEQQCAGDVPKGELAGLVKAVEFQFPKGYTGTREVAVTIETSKNITAGSTLDISYRAYSLAAQAASIFPAEPTALNVLVAKLTAGQKIVQQDFCNTPVKTEKLAVSKIPMQCDAATGICARVWFQDPLTNKIYSDAATTTLGGTLNANIEVISEKSNVDVVKLSTSHFTLIRSTELSSASLQEQAPLVIPIAAAPGKKTGVTLQLRASKTGSAAPLAFIFEPQASQSSFTVNKLASVTGTNTFTVEVAPSFVYAAEGKRNINLRVRDRLGQDVKDATVELYDCDAAPLDGQIITVTGDGSRGKGDNANYLATITPVAVGDIGVRVSGEGYRTFDECIIPVRARNFLSVTPESLVFDGDSSQIKDAQTITVSNLLGTEARVSATVRCLNPSTIGGAPVGNALRVFPLSCKLKANGDCQFNIALKQNVSANTLCTVVFNARAGIQAQTEEEVNVQVNARCPNCPVYLQGVPQGAASLPARISLFASPFSPLSQAVFQINLGAQPKCAIEGLQPIPPYGAPYAGFQSGVGFSASPFAQVQYPTTQGLPAACSYPALCYNPQGCQLCANPPLYAQDPYPPGCKLADVCRGPQSCGMCQGASSLYRSNYAPNAYAGANQFSGFPLASPYYGASQYHNYAVFSEGAYGYSPSWFGIDSPVTIDECSSTGLAVSTHFIQGPPVSMSARIVITLPDGTQNRIPVQVIAQPPLIQGQNYNPTEREWLESFRDEITIEVPYSLKGEYEIAAGNTDVESPLCTLRNLQSIASRPGDSIEKIACSNVGVRISYDFSSLSGKSFDEIRTEIAKKKASMEVRSTRAAFTKTTKINFAFPFKTPTMSAFIEYRIGNTSIDPMINKNGLLAGTFDPVKIGNGKTILALSWTFPDGDDSSKRRFDIVKGLAPTGTLFRSTDALPEIKDLLRTTQVGEHLEINELGMPYVQGQNCRAENPCIYWIVMHAYAKDGTEIPNLPFQKMQVVQVGSDDAKESGEFFTVG
jgi:hypothetical protein